LSGNVRRYLEGRNLLRQPLQPKDAAAIQALPGDAFYVDGEVGLADLIIQRRLSNYWSAYLTIPYINYGQGAFDSTIESFHDTFGFSQQGRDLVARNQFQIVYSIGDANLSLLNRSGRHAFYLSGSAVYYSGGPEVPGDRSQIIPTFIAGYGFGITRNVNLILQGYASRSVIQDATVLELTKNKYQLSFGLQARTSNVLWSLALTENVSNFSNTPDIGAQLGIAYMPKAR
jgi:hypothetical protein